MATFFLQRRPLVVIAYPLKRNIDRSFEALSPPYPATTSIPATTKKRGFRERQYMEDTSDADGNGDRPIVDLLPSAPMAPIQSRAPRLMRAQGPFTPMPFAPLPCSPVTPRPSVRPLKSTHNED
ncbi:hypothetical protein EKO27_g11324 [Xylaria grammica]|uniref:Uncharacterized protein n=1 Tax=Xylaria grammica TaxID=363999 RepID=A0A439CNV9_9PEZI|nr:hypothetical protein EKO27_g11324 [Xylaria grammica]